MEELRQEFLSEAISNLETLQKELQSFPDFSLPDSFIHKIFRCLHTIKGTSQTFGFNLIGKFAHEVENLLQALRDSQIELNQEVFSAVNESVRLLLKILQNEQTQQTNVYPKDFVGKINSLIPDSATKTPYEDLSEKIPQNFLTQLSVGEMSALKSAVGKGSNFYFINVNFEFSDFDEEFKKFIETLNMYGKIIATAGSEANSPNQIGFNIFFVSEIEVSQIIEIIKPFKANLVYKIHPEQKNYSNNLNGILAGIVENGEKTAQSLGKKIDFQTSSDDISLSPKILKIIHEILLHLIRNAVDHAIELPETRLAVKKNSHGNIRITASQLENQIVLRIEDDGRGINIDKINEIATEKNIISAGKILTEKEALEIIFLPGFSSSKTISEVSGRGVGLDAVKEVVNQANGNIYVRTKPRQGTVFEVHLPQDF